jgi:hypothetical protein
MTIQSQRDVVFTPFMLRVRAALDGEKTQGVRLRPSTPQKVATATDEWFYLRCRSEQVIAEANAMIAGRGHLIDLEDEVGTGRLAFTLRCRERITRIWMGRIGRKWRVELDRSYAPSPQAVEPEDPETLEDLVIELMSRSRSHADE